MRFPRPRLPALKDPRQWSRRDFLTYSTVSIALAGSAALAYGAVVRDHVDLTRIEIQIAHLPSGFDGLTIAHMSDLHHGPYTSQEYLHRCVEIVNGLNPDLVTLTGDFTFGGKRYIGPCAEVLKGLKPRVGAYASLGNHDYYVGAGLVAQALHAAGLNVMVDEKQRLDHRGDRIWIVGADDLYHGETDLRRLTRDIGKEESRVVLAHQPDYIEEFAARKVHADLILSGHTHAGQIRFPLIGAPHVPSHYGQKYAAGLARNGAMQIYTTRGIGTVMLPSRIDCPPEIVLYTLRPA